MGAFAKALEVAKQNSALTEEELETYKWHIPLLKAEAGLQWAVENEDPEDIAMAISDALRVGVDPEYISRVEKELVQIRERSKLRQRLKEVIVNGTASTIREAIDLAEHTGVRGHEIERAKTFHKRLLAREELVHAEKLESKYELQMAIDHAKAAGLEQALIENAEQVLVRLGLRTDLNIAMESNDVDALYIQIKKVHDFIEK